MSINPAMLQSQLTGDGNPKLFDFNSPITPQELMVLYITSGVLEKGIRWLPAQALSTGWTFKTEEPFTAEKFPGKQFEFESFTDWFKWSGAYEEVINAMSFALLFGKARIFFYSSEDIPSKYKEYPFYAEIKPGELIMTKAVAMYPYLEGNGWKIAKSDEEGEPEIYKISVTDKELYYEDAEHKAEEKVHYVHRSRVVAFSSPKKTLGYEGTAKSQTIAHLVKLQKQMLQAVFVQCKNLIAGYIIYRAKNKDQSDAQNKLLENFSHLTRLGWSGSEDLEEVLKMVVPDFRSDQLQGINLMISKAIASNMNISLRNLGEEDIAAGIGQGGAMISHELTLLEIKEMQRFFQRPLEFCFYLMGKEDTSLVWNEPMVQDEELQQEENEDELNEESSDSGNTDHAADRKAEKSDSGAGKRKSSSAEAG